LGGIVLDMSDIEKKTPSSESVNHDIREGKVIDAPQVDEALNFLRHGDIGTLTEVDEKKLLRKIDWMIMP
jgi:hypothetical protein